MSPQLPLTFDRARQQADRGIAASAAHADRAVEGWGGLALAALSRYAAAHETFMAEDVVDSARAAGVPDPPDGRAWGHVLQRARRAHVIEACGYGPARTSNLSPKVRWRSLVYAGPLLSN